MRKIIFARHIYYRYGKMDLQQEELAFYYNLLVLPLDSQQPIVEPKTVLKWLLASILNNNTHMTSTAEDSPDNLVVSLEI